MSTTTTANPNPHSHVPSLCYYWHDGENSLNDYVGYSRLAETNDQIFIDQFVPFDSVSNESWEEEHDFEFRPRISGHLGGYYQYAEERFDMDCDEFEDC
jgi:hypothetical protein